MKRTAARYSRVRNVTSVKAHDPESNTAAETETRRVPAAAEIAIGTPGIDQRTGNPFQTRYSTKGVIDAFLMRARDVFHGGVLCLVSALGLEPISFAALNVTLTAFRFFVFTSISIWCDRVWPQNLRHHYPLSLRRLPWRLESNCSLF